jgi:hypothetical protein
VKLLTKALHEKLLANGRTRPEDPKPVVKFFTPWGSATWLLTELDADGDTMFGLCDLGHGFPELGYVSLRELESLRGPAGLKVERDLYFEADEPLSKYTEKASAEGRIVA